MQKEQEASSNALSVDDPKRNDTEPFSKEQSASAMLFEKRLDTEHEDVGTQTVHLEETSNDKSEHSEERQNWVRQEQKQRIV